MNVRKAAHALDQMKNDEEFTVIAGLAEPIAEHCGIRRCGCSVYFELDAPTVSL